MATVYVNIGRAGSNGASSDAPIRKTTTRTATAMTTSTSAAYVQEGAGNLVLKSGDMVDIHTDGAIVVRFNGVATATQGHRISPLTGSSALMPFLCDADGQMISIINQ